MSRSSNPAGWYRDPDRPRWHRYWNGDSWEDPLAESLPAPERRWAPWPTTGLRDSELRNRASHEAGGANETTGVTGG